MKYLSLLSILGLLLASPVSWSDSRRVVRVGIIGGGISGATFARVLDHINQQQKDIFFDVVIYEKSDRVGGRMLSEEITVKLPSGKTRKVIQNLGTQINFEGMLSFFDKPEFVGLNLHQYFPLMHARVSATVASNSTGRIETFLVPTHTDTQSVRDLQRAQNAIPNLVSTQDAMKAALATYFLQDVLLKREKIGSIFRLHQNINATGRAFNAKIAEFLPEYPYQVFPNDFDKFSAREFLEDLEFPLIPTVETSDFMNPFKWFGLWAKAADFFLGYMAGDDGKTIDYGVQAMINTLYAQGQTTVGFPKSWIEKVIEPAETLVEFTTPETMSALNFVWQNNWLLKGGRMITAPNGFNKLPEALIASLSKNVKLSENTEVTKVKDQAGGGVALEIVSPAGKETVPFDIVYSTLDSPVNKRLLQGSKAVTPEMAQVLDSTEYSATIGLLLATDRDSEAIFAQPAVGLAFERKLVKVLGGLTFQSGYSGINLEGTDIVSAWLPTDVSLDFIKTQKQKGWTDKQLQDAVRKAVLADINHVASLSPGNQDLRILADTMSSATLVGFKVWPVAVPLFQKGYVGIVGKYRSTLGRLPNKALTRVILGGQSVYQRTIADTFQLSGEEAWDVYDLVSKETRYGAKSGDKTADDGDEKDSDSDDDGRRKDSDPTIVLAPEDPELFERIKKYIKSEMGSKELTPKELAAMPSVKALYDPMREKADQIHRIVKVKRISLKFGSHADDVIAITYSSLEEQIYFVFNTKGEFIAGAQGDHVTLRWRTGQEAARELEKLNK